MRKRRIVLVGVALLTAGILLPASRTSALQPEDGPMYLTDSHGAASVVWSMLTLAEVDGRYLECAEQTLAWLMSIKKTDEQGRVTWYLSDSAPTGHPNRRVTPPGLSLPALMFFDTYEKTKKIEYRDMGLAATRWIADVGSNRWKTDLGMAYGWPFFFGQKDVGLISGHSHGLGKYMQLLMRAHKIEADAAFEKALKGILINLKTNAVPMGDGMVAWPPYKWPHLKEKDVFLTGFCYGQAGVVIPLMDLAKAMPDLKLSDGTTPLGLGNSALRYLMSQARPAKNGHVWPYMRWAKDSKNPGLGSGTGGVGWALFRGYQVNREIGDKAFADECLKYARGAAEYALALIDGATQEQAFKGGGGDGGFGLCGGAGGTAWLPILLAKEIGEQDPEFLEHVRKSTRHLADLLIARATPVGDTLAWTLSPGEYKHHEIKTNAPVVNMALDYGQTGVAIALCEMGRFLNDDEVLAAAKKAGDFILNNAVKTEHGWKFARFVIVETR